MRRMWGKLGFFLFGIMLLVFGILNLIPLFTYMNYDSLPVSKIGNLGEDESGDLVKIEGTISRCDDGRLVIWSKSTVRRDSDSSGSHTHVDTDHYYADEFYVADKTGEIHVFSDSGKPIYLTETEDYYVHEDIVVVGEFELSGTEKVLYLEAVSEDTDNFVSSQGPFQYFSHFLIIMGLILIIVPSAMFLYARRKNKKAATSWHPPDGAGATLDTIPAQTAQPPQYTQISDADTRPSQYPQYPEGDGQTYQYEQPPQSSQPPQPPQDPYAPGP